MSDSIESLEEAVRHSPQNVPLRLYLARVLSENGYWGRALGHYRAALDTEPGNVEACLGLGQSHLQQGEAAEAVRVLNRGLGMDPERPQSARLHVAISRALLALGHVPDALEHYKNGVRADPGAADRELVQKLEEGATAAGTPGPLRMAAEDGPSAAFRDEGPAGINFTDVGGMDELKESLRMSIVYPFRNPEIFRAYGKSVGGGILLYGPPGCGKTYIARATAGEIQARFFAVGLSDVMDMWYGESERKLHELFETARSQAPAVLFFDEVEALGHSRHRMSGYAAGRTLVNQFLAEMDGIQSQNQNLLVMGATNSPWDLDPAFRRPGRFDRIVFVAPPDQSARVEILKLHTRTRPVENLEYEKIASRMERFSGADIRAVCEAASEKALQEALRSGQIRKITTADFLDAVKRIRPSTSEWLETAQNYARYSNRSGLYNEVIEYLNPRK